MQCTFHKNSETLLRCSKCELPICDRCTVQTPVGARCPGCANVQRIPTYNLSTQQLTQAVGVSMVVGFVLGLAFGLCENLIPFRMVWIYVPAAFVSSGYVIGASISRVTNHKRSRMRKRFRSRTVATSMPIKSGLHQHSPQDRLFRLLFSNAP